MSISAALPTAPGRRRVLAIAVCQALSMTSNVILFTTAALIGHELATDKSLATFPLFLLQLAVTASTLLAAGLMKQWGRRAGFMVGTLLGILGAVVAAVALVTHSFVLFCVGAVFLGGFNAFVGFYRFAAAEVASDSFRSQAIAWVVASGVISALVGPPLANWTKDLFPAVTFAGCMAMMVALQGVTLLALWRVPFAPVIPQEQQKPDRPLSVILARPVFQVAVIGSSLGYGVMVLVMTATPLAMVEVGGHPFHEAAFVIQWHVVAMFAPSFFTGNLIARFGVLTVVLTGAVFNLACMSLNLLGDGGVWTYWFALVCLGIGWNFMYIGSSTLLTEAYTPAEKAQAQAAHDFLMAGCVALCSLLSGTLLQLWGWVGVNLAGIPMVMVALGFTLWLRQGRRQGLYPRISG